jgi:DNA topoisomerase I
MKTLVIVESPAKAHKIQEYLGADYVVMASKGHIADLAKGGKMGLGVDVDNNFKPKYVINDDKLDMVDALMAAAKKADNILLMSDSDREGEAIAWHLQDRLQDVGTPIKRATFNEIKKSALQKAIKNAREVDLNMFASQEARRILDRLVGFTASPFLMNCYGSNPPLSAGRVQSVVTKIVIDREREIEQFVPETFWTIQVKLTDNTDPFVTKFTGKLTDEATAKSTKTALTYNDYLISEVVSQEEKKSPSPPLVTSTLQRIMSKQHNFSADRTMKAAQAIYEAGFCTYIRSDSVRVGEEALTDVRQWLTDNNHPLPKKSHTYKNKEAAQDAHECIRPSDINLLPWDNSAMSDPDEKMVYETIWRHFVSSQMMPAVYDTLSIMAHPANDPTYTVKASGKALKVKGFLEILGVSDQGSIDIPNLTVGQTVHLAGGKSAVKLEKKQTQPPPRFSEDKLIKELDNRGIGRPATYAELLSKITLRNYVEKKGNVFHATDLGKTVTDELDQYFTFMDYDYTAQMERQLDLIEQGKLDRTEMLRTFWNAYRQEVNAGYMGHGAVPCDQCGSPMIKRESKSDGSSFLGCINFPRCRATKPMAA